MLLELMKSLTDFIIKKQIDPTNAARTGAKPLRNAITSAPQFNGQDGRTAKTVKAIKIKPTIIEIINFLNEDL